MPSDDEIILAELVRKRRRVREAIGLLDGMGWGEVVEVVTGTKWWARIYRWVRR